MIVNNSKLLIIILSLVSAILLAVLIMGVYNVQIKNREASELFNLANQAAEARILAQSIEVAQEDAAEDLTAFESLTLSGDKLVPLIESIEEVGRRLDLDARIVSVEKIEDSESLEPDMIQVVLETRGPWSQTLSFIRAIESLPHRVMMEETSLSRVESKWHLRIVLSLYSFD